MDNSGFMQYVLQALKQRTMAPQPPNPAQAPVGSGAAQQAVNTVDLRKQYNDYAIDAQSNGEQPVPFEQWAAQQQNRPVLRPM